ncbi:Macrolide export ATP-binding/permease protein MacB [Maioricimonas rarisocia]|uniref:Macrolide export ATP-binding/permease protein MacB n=1 Tax=Maioricimonas rarisocia TaxID=2528026 RepID=A0A517ZAA8_9PLAN|nr:ABC transporter permease [Maioricimonas rarisocia]QDU39349.1 Macrolide export ATP-binding/permease protein MacB [Maioricimonas rarisocia]
MTLPSMIWQELRSRPWAVLSNSLAILLGVAALVAIRHVTVHSEQEVSSQLSELGANILVLPPEATLQDYYAADQNGGTIPEEYVSEIYLAGLTGVEQVSPRLNVPARLGDLDVTLTGILPQSELEAQTAWQTTAMFTAPQAHEGCTHAQVTSVDLDSPDALVTHRAIQNLSRNELVLGADVAARADCAKGDTVEVLGHRYTVLGVLPSTGTVDDSRVFAHLHTVQDSSNSGQVCNAIEVIGCCEDAAGDLVPELRALLPRTRVVTISQVVQTQVGVNRLMANTSWFVLAVLVVVGGASLAGAIAANVRERRREIGTLMALGATPRFVQRLFLGKALVLGLTAGTLGGLIGIATAIVAGPSWAGVTVSVLPATVLLAVLMATLLALVSAWWPARQAAGLDPCLCFQEI